MTVYSRRKLNKSRKFDLLASVLALGLSAAALADPQVDSGLSDYQRASGVSGNLSSVGSDTLANLMLCGPRNTNANTRT